MAKLFPVVEDWNRPVLSAAVEAIADLAEELGGKSIDDLRAIIVDAETETERRSLSRGITRGELMREIILERFLPDDV